MYDRVVRAYVKELDKPKWLRNTVEVANTVRGLTLGSDVGTLLRQGRNAISNPIEGIRAIKAGLKAVRSDADYAVTMKRLRDRRIDGKNAYLVGKKAGLQLTDTLIEPEEMIVGRILKKIPGIGKLVGKPLERFQVAYINELRAGLFDRALVKGLTPEEL